MAVVKVSVRVDADTLRDIRKIAGKGATLSSIVDEALRLQLHRMSMLALLDEMEKRNPVTPAGREAGEKLWAEIESSWTQARSRRSRRTKTRSE